MSTPSTQTSESINSINTQHSHVIDERQQKILCELNQRVSDTFPSAAVSFLAAYGSGVIPQTGYGHVRDITQSSNAAAAANTVSNDAAPVTASTHASTSSESTPMIDLMFGVDDAVAFHQHNIRMNPEHYSVMGSLGANTVAQVQSWGAGVYFNAFIPWSAGMQAKYGVISNEALIHDLEHWDSLYLAGRLHKPVKLLRCTPSIEKALHTNLTHAVSVATLILPQQFDELQLYQTICSLSYAGDIRTQVGGENPNKVDNIVTANLTRFRKLYAPILAKSTLIRSSSQDALSFEHDAISDAARLKAVDSLPANMKLQLYGDDTTIAPPQKEAILAAVQNIVARSSRAQTVKGILTSGIVKSVKYAFMKLRKGRVIK
jgi:mitochondrial translocator assembly and maintenance protein 41